MGNKADGKLSLTFIFMKHQDLGERGEERERGAGERHISILKQNPREVSPKSGAKVYFSTEACVRVLLYSLHEHVFLHHHMQEARFKIVMWIG